MNPNVKTIGINTALPVILIDTSIFQFTVVLQKAKKLYKKEYANSDEHTTKDSSEHFMQIFKDTFVDEINKYALKYGTVKSNILLCNDTPRDMVWRRQVDPTYKLHRGLKDNDPEKIESNKVYNAFWRQYDTMHQPMHVVELQRLESDDIVYLICKKLEKVKNNSVSITVLTTDSDYLQLENNNVRVLDFHDKMLKSKTMFPEENLVHKILCGDKSDNVMRVIDGLTPRVCDNILNDLYNERLSGTSSRLNNKARAFLTDYDLRKRTLLERLSRLFESEKYKKKGFHVDSNFVKNLDVNMELIRLELIPRELQAAFHARYSFSTYVQSKRSL